MKRTLWAMAYAGPAAYLLYLAGKHLPLFDPNPPVNLTLRFVMMDLLPVLWVVPLFNWKGLTATKFLFDLRERGSVEPAPLAAPSLALLLFAHESFLAVVEPDTAQAVPMGSVLWMQAATALMAAIVFFYGTRGRPEGADPYHWLSVLFYLVFFVGGWKYFFATGCDISRLLVTVGLSSVIFQLGSHSIRSKPPL